MSDPVPLTDDEFVSYKRWVDDLRAKGADASLADRLVATVEQARSQRDAAIAELKVMRGLHAGAVDAVHELQTRLDAWAADLGRFTQAAVSKTKELEARLLDAIRRAETGEPDHE